MNTHRIVAAGILAMTTAGLSHPAWALMDRVKYVDIRQAEGIYVNDAKIVVEAANGKYSKVTSGNSVRYHMEMQAGCKGVNSVLKSTYITLGAPPSGNGIIEYSDKYKVMVPNGGKRSIGYTPTQLDIPLNQLNFDPVQACNEMMAFKQQQGISKMQIMNSEWHVLRPVTMSAVASCGLWHNETKDYFKKAIHNGYAKIICKGAGGSGIGSIKAKETPLSPVDSLDGGYQPLQITDASISTNKTYDSGYCPANKTFTVRFKGHGKGQVRYTVTSSGKNVYKSPILDYDSSEGYKQHQFSITVDLKKDWPETVNQQLKRDVNLYIEQKDAKGNKFDWSQAGSIASLLWYYTCKPKTTVPMGTPELKAPTTIPVKPGQIKPKAQPTQSGKAARSITRVPPDPKPTPKLNIKATPIQPEAERLSR